MNNNINSQIIITKAIYEEAKERGINIDKEIEEGRIIVRG